MTSAAILAGGRARRLDGLDKSQLRVAGRTILERQLAALNGCVDRVLLVGYRGDPPGDERIAVVDDRLPACGPLGGLDAALVAAGDAAVLLLACDMPHVTTRLLSYMVCRLGDADAVVPLSERGYHPLCAVYAQSCRVPVRRRLEQGQLRMLDLLGDLRVRAIDTTELEGLGGADHLLANLNTRADIDALESL